MSYSSESFTIFTIVSMSLFLIHSIGTLHFAIALTCSEIATSDISLFQLDHPSGQISHI